MPARPPSPLILVVEDNPADIYLLRRALGQAYPAGTIQVIDNGDQAWRYLRREAPYTDAPTPALLTLDMNLPARHGTEILSMIRHTEALRALPVIVVSSITAEAQPETAALADGWFVKPNDADGYAQLSQQAVQCLGG